jgi:hypothetical protein
VSSIRAIAVDWSGARDPRRTMWLAEAVQGRIVRLESGRRQGELVDHLLQEAKSDPRLVVGLDFAFSLPSWYLEALGIPSAPALWSLVAREALTERMARQGLAQWLANPEPPFWGRAGKAAAGLTPEREFRRTDLDIRRLGFPAQSVFKLVGAGHVGTGSLRGMPALDRLRRGGFAVWPFDESRLPLVVEIYPRALMEAVTKSSEVERRRHLSLRRITGEEADAAAASEHAFDALVSALAMDEHVQEFLTLERAPEDELEGRIWTPRPGADGALPRAELVRRLAEVSHRSWMRQAHRDKGIPFEDLIPDVTEHDLERAEDTVRELERLGVVSFRPES